MRKRHSWYRIQNAAKSDEATVYIYDEIESFFGVRAQDFVKELAGIKASTVHVRLNCPGGDVFDAMAIYNALKRHPAEIVTHVDGIAASAASIVALAGDRVLMGAGTFMMIHNAWGIAIGDAKSLREMADRLEKVTDSLVGIYTARTGMDGSEIQQLLDAETWFTAEEAVAQGFADATEEGKRAAASYDLSRFKNVPQPLAEAQAADPTTPSTIREFEAFLRDEGGFSHAAARAIAAAGFKGTPEPRDEDVAGLLAGIQAQLAQTQLAAALSR